jgi:hypothetical protein
MGLAPMLDPWTHQDDISLTDESIDSYYFIKDLLLTNKPTRLQEITFWEIRDHLD